MYIKKYWGNFIGGSDDSLNKVIQLAGNQVDQPFDIMRRHLPRVRRGRRYSTVLGATLLYRSVEATVWCH